jgi:hypothetical protein
VPLRYRNFVGNAPKPLEQKLPKGQFNPAGFIPGARAILAVIILSTSLSQMAFAVPAEETQNHSHCYFPLSPKLLRIFYPAEVRLYLVRGRNVEQIAGAIQHHGPYDNQHELRYTGYYKGAVSFSDGVLEYRSYITLPCLRRMSSEVRRKWRKYISTIARHELNHHRLFIAGIREFQLSPREKSENSLRRIVNSMKARDMMWDSIDVIPPFDKF